MKSKEPKYKTEAISGIRTWVFITTHYNGMSLGPQLKFWMLDVPHPYSFKEEEARKYFENTIRHTGTTCAAALLEGFVDEEVNKALRKAHKAAKRTAVKGR